MASCSAIPEHVSRAGKKKQIHPVALGIILRKKFSNYSLRSLQLS
jgi:hypothetical protein